MHSVTIETALPTAPPARALLKQSHELMNSLFPKEANHYFSVEALAAPHIRFLIAKRDAQCVGCAALANQGTYGEIKSMFVDAAARGHGVAEKLIGRLKNEGRAQNLASLKLETGIGLDAAHRLYERHGFTDCAAFGDYQPDARYSRYMELSL